MTNSCTYTAEQFSAILGSFQHRSALDKVQFRQSVERCAWLYVEGKQLTDRIARPAQRVMLLQRLGKKLTDFSAGLSGVRDDPYVNRLLNDAAREGNEQEANVGEDTPVVDRARMQKLVGELAWLGTVIKKAEPRAEMSKSRKGGNRADVALYELLLAAAEVYAAAAVNPARPSGWSADSGSDEFLSFLQKLCQPLGVVKSDGALRESYRAALAYASCG